MTISFTNAFVKPTQFYKRDINVLKHYLDDSSLYLSISTGKPIEECKKFISQSLQKEGQFEFKDPKVVYLQRQENGDRIKLDTSLSKYIEESVAKKQVIAPTFTTYIGAHEQQSLLATYVDANVKARGTAKKAMFTAKAAGDNNLANIKKIEQTNRKLSNNAISGAHVSPSTPLYNKSAHSTLTSTCRSTSGLGNANNEKFLSGNRHYFNHHIVLNNIISIVRNTDYIKLQNLIDKYRIHVPTVEETIECVSYSTNLYWSSNEYFKKISDLIENLKPIERAAFVYTGDLHHLMKYNEMLIKEFIKKLATKIVGVHPEPAVALKNAPEDHCNLAHQICAKETQGIGKDYTSILDKPAIHTLALTVENVAITIMQYADLIDTLWVTNNFPASVAHFPDSIRRSALTSDTDSTIFTVQDWVIWYKGKISFDEEATAVAAVMIFLASSTITHLLAMMSANFGIAKDRLSQIAMKNEFKFDVFIPTQIGKHYYAAISCQEGNVFKEHENEIKGVSLKSSSSPKPIIKAATEMMEDIMQCVMKDGKVSVVKYLKQVADIEREIIASIKKGEFVYLRSSSIKGSNSYKSEPEKSPYQQHLFWNEIFGDKYGKMPEPPYATSKVSVEIDTPVKYKEWLEGIKDIDFKNRLITYMTKTGKTYIGTLNFPAQCLQSKGMPVEILGAIDFRKIVADLCSCFYLILETIGVYMNEKKVMRLCMDFY